MKQRNPQPMIRAVLALATALALAGCGLVDRWQASRAYGRYQTAAAEGSVVGVRDALLTLVQIDEDVPSYWTELAKAQVQLGDFADAYYALNRAYELDRGNASLLRSLTELALRSGSLDLAEEHARQLDMIAVGDPFAKLTRGYVALRRGRLDEAEMQADQLLQVAPFDSNAKVLKARVLLARGKREEASELLSEQIRLQPSDIASLQALASMNARFDDWKAAAAASQRILELRPNDQAAALLRIEAALRSGDNATALRTSLAYLKPSAGPETTQRILDLWADLWSGRGEPLDPPSSVNATGADQQQLYAEFFNIVGRPDLAARLIAEQATLPVEADNAEANALLAEAMRQGGKLADAKKRFDAVLSFDQGQVQALRGRTKLELQLGQGKQALYDAQRLVSALPGSASARILLADVYGALGQHREQRRTLWEGFHQIPGSDALYSALSGYLARTTAGDPDVALRVRQEYDRQRGIELMREFI